ncbi:ATP-binding cassette domain-containing protein [Candidatus Woesearchaeota archaeon]|nr:ATP-binding cassette domain-containing protein [Candidatus Woesearchaeota archaeon]
MQEKTLEDSWIRKIFTIVPSIKEGLGKGVLISLFYEAVKLSPILLVKYLVDFFVTGQDNTFKLIAALGGILASYLILEAVDYYTEIATQRWLRSYELEILRKTKKKLLEMHLGYHETFSTGTQVSKIVKGVHRLVELIWFTFEEFIPTSIQLLITLALLLNEQWILAGVFALFTPIIIGITLYEGKKVQPLRKEYHRKFDEAVGELGESVFNIATVKDYVQEKEQFKRFDSLLREYVEGSSQRFKFSHRLLLWRDLTIAAGRITTLAIAAYLVFQDRLSPGSLVLAYSLTERAFLGTQRMGRLYSFLGDAMESINRLVNLLQEKPAIINSPNAISVNHLKGEIAFERVSFSYNDNKEVIHNFSLYIKPQKVVAFVGRSGSGKSTLAKLLLRNYDVQQGKIIIDGKDVRQYKIEDYKKRIAVVSQNVEIFNRTILENIQFADPTTTRKEVIAAAKKAHAHQFIMDFPKGYNTLVGEKGIRLSGGQKQRISIARALLKNPDIYVFDEATSSLDSESEQYIQNSIFSIAGKKTTIIIAHRLSTIRKADLIVVLDQGKVVEQGKYEALVQKKQGIDLSSPDILTKRQREVLLIGARLDYGRSIKEYISGVLDISVKTVDSIIGRIHHGLGVADPFSTWYTAYDKGIITLKEVIDEDRASLLEEQLVFFTSREREVLQRYAYDALKDGYTERRYVAKALGITPKTLDTHCINIYTKIGIHNRAQMATIAYAQTQKVII